MLKLYVRKIYVRAGKKQSYSLDCHGGAMEMECRMEKLYPT